MLLLAQQQILAAEEAREESSKPRFVATAGGTQAARVQAARDRQKKLQETAGLLARSAAGRGDNDGEDGLTGAGWGGSGPAVMIPTAPGMLSGENLGVGGLDEELEEIRRRVSGDFTHRRRLSVLAILDDIFCIFLWVVRSKL